MNKPTNKPTKTRRRWLKGSLAAASLLATLSGWKVLAGADQPAHPAAGVAVQMADSSPVPSVTAPQDSGRVVLFRGSNGQMYLLPLSEADPAPLPQVDPSAPPPIARTHSSR